MTTLVPRFRREASTRRAGWHPWRENAGNPDVAGRMQACSLAHRVSSQSNRVQPAASQPTEGASIDARSLRSEVASRGNRRSPVDPHTLSESQIKFGVAPKRDPSVDYQPGIILMENGDKAIKSVASGWPDLDL